MGDITVVVVPFPAQGHLNVLLHFALRLASTTQFSVHYATSPSHILQAKSRLQVQDSESLQNIHFHALEIPPFPSPPPDSDSISKFPSHLLHVFRASLDLQAPLASLLRSLSSSCRRLVVIHDRVVPYAGHEAALIPNAESYRFSCVPIFNELPRLWNNNSSGSECDIKQDVLDVIQTQYGETTTTEFREFLNAQHFESVESGNIFNGFRAIDGEFLDVLVETERYRGKNLYVVGPLNPIAVKNDARSSSHECLDWLDKQPVGSVVYVSFGSTTTFSDEQIEQLAIGLKSSGQRFVWVLRDADRGDIFAEQSTEQQQRKLASGLDMAGDSWIVVRDWAPQLEILAHPSTAAFMTHCGWNSCMESLSNGVAMIAWPMHSDQPLNAKMVTGYLKAGIMLRDWDRRDEVIGGEEIEEVITRMMVSDEGEEIRKRAKAIGEEARLAVTEGGSSQKDMESFIAHVSR